MLLRIFVALLIYSGVELYVFVRAAGALGWLSVLGIVLVTAVLGVSMARLEGLRVLMDTQAKLRRGELPEAGPLEGALVLLGGALLVSPGLVSDVLGLGLMIPAVRARIAARASRALQARFVVSRASSPFGPRRGDEDESVIDVEAIEEDDEA